MIDTTAERITKLLALPCVSPFIALADINRLVAGDLKDVGDGLLRGETLIDSKGNVREGRWKFDAAGSNFYSTKSKLKTFEITYYVTRTEVIKAEDSYSAIDILRALDPEYARLNEFTVLE